MPTPGRNRLGQAEEKAETLDQSQKWRLRYWEKHTVKKYKRQN